MNNLHVIARSKATWQSQETINDNNMKKIFFSLVALAALAACSKSEVEYTDNMELSFVPVSKLSTKAAVADTDYPDALNMYVFANAGLDSDADGTVENTECADPYFANAEFTNTDRAANVFGGATPYYWPNVKSLWFAGVSKSGNVNDDATPSVDFSTKVISLPGYAPGVGANVEGDNDLMFFNPIGAYNKANHATNPIQVTMHHACSWITVRVAGNTVSGAANTTWKIKALKITELALTGNLTVTDGDIDWDESTADGEFGLKTATEDVKLTTLLTDLLTSTNAIVIPQAPANLYVQYEYESQPAQGTVGEPGYVAPIVTTEETTIPLTYDGANEWLPGYHYTYDLTISAQEILLLPVAEEWVDYDDDTAEDGVQNPTINN